MSVTQRIFVTVFVLFAMTSLSFGATPAQVLYFYPGDWDHSSHDPLTYESCWTGTGIPLGSEDVLYPFIEGVEYGPYDFNDWGGLAGYFTMDYYAGGGVGVEGDVTYLEVRYEGCIYRTGEYILGPGAIDIPLYENDWIYCNCGIADTCDSVDPLEEGFDGPHDILSDDTLSFIDTCTVRITAQGGDAHGVSVEVYDGIPECHPVDFNYMSRVVAVYWDGSADEGTTLLVRMYYSSDEFDESGFDGVTCLFAARFNELACSWAPIIAHDKTEKYVEFATDRSGFFTFDCHGTTPRRIPLNSDPTITAGDNELVLCWQTIEEFETYRFHVLRAEAPEGPFAEVATIPSQLPDIKTTGSYNYEYQDGGLENGHVYYYKLSREDLHGNQDGYPGIFSGVPSLNGGAVKIEAYALHPAYPNPFNPETRITYDVLEAGRVDLRVFDILGREVALLVDDVKLKGRHNIVFNAKDLPSGLYFYRIDIGGQFTSTQKILLIK